ncbi:MAG TPA: hypothetical protein VLM43_17215, partial [Desulfobacterales bacterium]|nr:hypothetical protein [Desulfobacterales bacterium]
MIENEKDSLFTLSDALIRFNPETDEAYLIKYSLSNRDSFYLKTDKPITIKKVIRLDNVHFPSYIERNGEEFSTAGLNNIIFENDVEFRETYSLSIVKCSFEQTVLFWSQNRIQTSEALNFFNVFDQSIIDLKQNHFYGKTRFSIFGRTDKDLIRVYLEGNHVEMNKSVKHSLWWFFNLNSVGLINNEFKSNAFHTISFEQLKQLTIEENSFDSGIPGISIIEIEELVFDDNSINVPSLLNIHISNNLSTIGINQFNDRASSLYGFRNYLSSKFGLDWVRVDDFQLNYNEYEYSQKIQNENYFNSEVEQKSEFYHYYKNKFNTRESNKYYTEIKALETQRMAYDHKNNPSFSTFFKLRINQFLKAFSNFGTQPERAVIFSLYVICAFALIYLFFPNSWDKHGRKRIMDRYSFFLKYMKREAGIHEVYLEEKRPELMEYEKFRDLVTGSNEQVPGFFVATGLPLYKWAISGARLHAAFLSKIDIMKGAWQDLPARKRLIKSTLLIGAFSIAIVYDLVIKILNALMLSINTFTTLGFGEIPIKGFP